MSGAAPGAAEWPDGLVRQEGGVRGLWLPYAKLLATLENGPADPRKKAKRPKTRPEKAKNKTEHFLGGTHSSKVVGHP